MVEDILESVYFWTIIQVLCGHSQWLVNRKRNKLVTSRFIKAYLIILLIGFTSYTFRYIGTENKNISGHMLTFLQKFTIILKSIATTSSIIVGIFLSHDKLFFEKVQEIDKIFHNSLEIKLENKLLKKWILKTFSLWLIIYILPRVINMTIKEIFSGGNHTAPVLGYMYYFDFLFSAILYFQFYLMVHIIKLRCEQLVIALNNLSMTPTEVKSTDTSKVFNFVDFSEENITKENPHMKQLLAVRDLHNKVSELCIHVNRYCGYPLLFTIGHDFCKVMFSTYSAFLAAATNPILTIVLLIHCIPYIFVLTSISSKCDSIINLKKKMACNLHKIKFDVSNLHHNILIERISMQFLLHELSLSAAGFFKINGTLLNSILGAVITYFIILLQFYYSKRQCKPKD